MTVRALSFWLPFFLVAIAGCHTDPTEIVLVVDTDLMVPGEVDNIHITVMGPTGSHPFDMDPAIGSPGNPSLPLSLTLEHQSGSALSPVTIAVVGLHGTTPIVRRDLRTGFVAGETRLLRVILARTCVDATTGGPRDCGADMTCSEAGCVAQAVPGSALLPFSMLPSRYDGGTFSDGCRPEICNGMDDNCNGVTDEGFDLMSEVANCGACGNDCRAKAGVATAHCASGMCVVDTCAPNRGDCNTGGDDGCETDTATSAMHCGTCPNACSTTNDTPTCAAGTCSVSCNTGFGDCDTMASTGCEADLTQIGNCGRCFHMCTTSCAFGYCDDDVVVQLATGGSHSCALQRSGKVLCWGANGNGRLGDGTTATHAAPTLVMLGALHAIAIAAGDQHTCAILMDHSVVCWGAGANGRLGRGSTLDSPTPVAVTGITDAATIAAGLGHTCVVRSGGGVKCWGRNGSGQLGNGMTTDALVPVDVGGSLTDATDVAAGQSHTCALRSTGGVSCWGLNDHAQLGTGSFVTMTSTPAAAVGITGAMEIASASGANHTCVRDVGGAVSCWGQGAQGQIGDGSTSDHGTATAAVLTMTATAIGVGATHSCAALMDGSVACWGANDHGQLGDGLTIGHGMPMPVVGAAMAAELVGGNAHTCARDVHGAVTCWGWNLTGQLGDGTMTDHPRPNPVRGLPF